MWKILYTLEGGPREKCMQSRGEECLAIVPSQFEGAENDRGCDFIFSCGIRPVRAISVPAQSCTFIFTSKVVL